MRKIILFTFCILMVSLLDAQQIYKAVALPSLSNGLTPNALAKYPSVILFGSGSLSGNIDSTVASSGKLHGMFMPNINWRIYAAINRGFKTDSLAVGETPPARNLLFPDANNMGAQFGISYSYLLTEFDNNTNGNLMQLVLVPYFEYLLQKRTFLLTDSASTNTKTFFAGNSTLGIGVDLNFFDNKENSVCLENRLGVSFMDIANNDVDDFRHIYAGLDSAPDKDLDDEYWGFSFQSAIKINGAGLFYKYNWVKASNDLDVRGLTRGQHFFGIILTAEVWDN